MKIDEAINIPYIKTTVEECCRINYGCQSCMGKNCLIGFSKIVADYSDVKKMLTIPGGIKMVPTEDFKVYEANNVAHALAVINLECKNCMDNHDDNCVINIIRSSLEIALLGQHIEFNGGSLSYIMALTQINPELGSKVMAEYNELNSK